MGVLGYVRGIIEFGAKAPGATDSKLDEVTLRGTKSRAGAAHQEYLSMGLVASAATAERMASLDDTATYSRLSELADELNGRLIDEMKARLFLFVDERNAELFDGHDLFGPDVTASFPSATVDIEEAAKCLALSRATACVFHLMRVMETGLRVLSATLKDTTLDPKNNPNWGVILSRCRAELSKKLANRSPEWAADEHFFSEASAMLESVKNAWRNPTMHVEIAYDDEKALDVWNSVRAFMRQLATKLHE